MKCDKRRRRCEMVDRYFKGEGREGAPQNPLFGTLIYACLPMFGIVGVRWFSRFVGSMSGVYNFSIFDLKILRGIRINILV